MVSLSLLYDHRSAPLLDEIFYYTRGWLSRIVGQLGAAASVHLYIIIVIETANQAENFQSISRADRELS